MKKKIKAILTPQEQKQVDAFVRQIDITNSQMVLQYGARFSCVKGWACWMDVIN